MTGSNNTKSEKEAAFEQTFHRHNTVLYRELRKAVDVAAAIARTGEGMLKPFFLIEDEELFEWALGYYDALLTTADEYEAKNNPW